MKGINKITSLEGLKAYALRDLGDDILEVEITPNQQTDRIDDALQMFTKYHQEGMRLTYSLLAVEAGEDTYTLDDDIIAIPFMIQKVQEILSEPTFSIQWEFLNERRWIGDVDLIGFELLSEKMRMIDIKFRQETGYDYNTTTNEVQFTPTPEENDIYALRVYRAVDPYDYPNVYNNDWLKKYVIALFRIQWGKNLTKHSGVQMINGATLNGEGILRMGLDDKRALEEELEKKHQLPIELMWG